MFKEIYDKIFSKQLTPPKTPTRAEMIRLVSSSPIIQVDRDIILRIRSKSLCHVSLYERLELEQEINLYITKIDALNFLQGTIDDMHTFAILGERGNEWLNRLNKLRKLRDDIIIANQPQRFNESDLKKELVEEIYKDLNL